MFGILHKDCLEPVIWVTFQTTKSAPLNAMFSESYLHIPSI